MKQYQNLFSTASNRFEKSKARTVGKILRKLYAIGNRKSFDKLQISWKKLFAFFFVTVVLKHEAMIPSIIFYCFLIVLMSCNFHR